MYSLAGLLQLVVLNGYLCKGFPVISQVCFSAGLVPSSVVLTAFQVASRLFLTWAIAYSVPQVSRLEQARQPIISLVLTHQNLENWKGNMHSTPGHILLLM